MKILFGERVFTTKENSLTVKGAVLVSDKNICKDVVYINNFNFAAKKDVNMQITVNDLRSLAIALRGIIINKKSSFKIFTESDAVKTLSLGRDGQSIFINTSGGGLNYKHKFDVFGTKSFIQTLELFCDELEKFTFAQQQKSHKEKGVNDE